ARGTRGQLRVSRERRNRLEQPVSVRRGFPAGEQLGLLGIRRRPGIVGLLPLLVAPHEALLVRGEVSADLIADEEVLVRGKAETGARGVCEFGTAFAMALRRTRDFRDSLRDGGLREDQLRATGGRPLGFVDRLL